MATNQMGLASKAKLTAIANAIRSKLGVSTQYSLDDMPTAIASISGGGGITPTGTKQVSINQNGTTTEDVTNYASAEITVNVPTSGITPTGTIQITENGTFDVTQYASAEVDVQSGGGGGTGDGWELIAEFTASEDVATINMEIPSAKRGMNVYKVQLTGETSASEWLYFKVNSTGAQTNGYYFQQARQYSTSFLAAKRGYTNTGVGYIIPANGNAGVLVTAVNIENIFMNLYNASSRFKSGFNVKLWGIN